MSFYNRTDRSFGFKVNPHESLFHAIYFIDYESGSLLVSNRFSKDLSVLGDDLICSFLNAINLFINELNGGVNEELREITFKGTRILYEREGRLLVIAVSRKIDLQVERTILREILEDFYLRFKEDINRFNGAITPGIINYKKRLEGMDLNSVSKFNSKF
ncbi:MAG: hypothetical protein ACXADU_03110 [Promethearchaeota archaeon]|jgi:hypothetical protein